MNQSEIINCYVANNSLSIKEQAYAGGIAGYAYNSKISNCYKFNIIFNKSSNWGQIIGMGFYDTIDYIYYDISTQKLIYNKTNCTQKHYKQYNTESVKTTEENQDIYVLLNQWINTQTTYSHTFTKWKSKTDLPAVFEE